MCCDHRSGLQVQQMQEGVLSRRSLAVCHIYALQCDIASVELRS